MTVPRCERFFSPSAANRLDVLQIGETFSTKEIFSGEHWSGAARSVRAVKNTNGIGFRRRLGSQRIGSKSEKCRAARESNVG
jgi:hypothetical protein